MLSNEVFTSSLGQLSAENNIKFSNLCLCEAFTKYFREALPVLIEYVQVFLCFEKFCLQQCSDGHEIEEQWVINIHPYSQMCFLHGQLGAGREGLREFFYGQKAHDYNPCRPLKKFRPGQVTGKRMLNTYPCLQKVHGKVTQKPKVYEKGSFP